VRDYKLIDQSDMVVVLYPRTELDIRNRTTGEIVPEERIILSAGVLCEMVYGSAHEKDVFAIWEPLADPSPFFSYHSKRWFRSTNEFWDHVRSSGLIQ
jgi:hypothetical protein